MSSDRPVIDLSGGHYDALEDKISQYLGLKILLIRDWQRPEMCSSYSRRGDVETFSSDDPEQQELSRQYMAWSRRQNDYMHRKTTVPPGEDPRDIAARDSLRAYLEERDPELGAAIDDDELNAINKTGHITLRAGNASPPYAVIVHDCDFSDPEKLQDWLFKLSYVDNVYNSLEKQANLPLGKFVEGVDIDPQQARTYEVLRQVRYALRHQHEHDNHDRGWYYMPYFYNFAALSDDKRYNIYDGYGGGFNDYKDMYEGDYFAANHSLGIEESFITKLTQARAIHDFRYLAINPVATLARLVTNHRYETGRDLQEKLDFGAFFGFQKTLRAEIKERCVARLAENIRDSYGYQSRAGDDLRIAVPVFREIYQSREWQGVEKLYLDTIWAGLTKYMPALAQAPLPTLKQGGTLPGSAAAYRQQQQAKPVKRPPSPPGPG